MQKLSTAKFHEVPPECIENRALLRLQVTEHWKCAPADGTNAALKMVRVRHVPVDSSATTLPQLGWRAKGANVRSWPEAAENDVRSNVGY
jgi:hypothetical protein